jgi:NAD-dependent dihydropyrimidine dehydrogenase PreA subunit
MKYIINQETCRGCGACQGVCPGAVTEEAEKCVLYAEGQYIIDAELCTGCGECRKICPTGSVGEVN